mmetsp:Transcript_18503/g.32106  ORF Transcript_18503/g.32106 Transcript_18503/m.32106 type:complete len:484 (+) Transcript_18503:1064-2515(+)
MVKNASSKIADGMLGRLDCLIIEAKNMKDTELFTRQDPYAELRIIGTSQIKKTQVSHETGTRAFWRETISLDVPPTCARDLKVKLAVYNKNPLRDTLIGTADIDLTHLVGLQVPAEDTWYRLFDAKGFANGAVLIAFTLAQRDLAQKSAPAAAAAAPATSSRQPIQPQPQNVRRSQPLPSSNSAFAPQDQQQTLYSSAPAPASASASASVIPTLPSSLSQKLQNPQPLPPTLPIDPQVNFSSTSIQRQPIQTQQPGFRIIYTDAHGNEEIITSRGTIQPVSQEVRRFSHGADSSSASGSTSAQNSRKQSYNKVSIPQIFEDDDVLAAEMSAYNATGGVRPPPPTAKPPVLQGANNGFVDSAATPSKPKPPGLPSGSTSAQRPSSYAAPHPPASSHPHAPAPAPVTAMVSELNINDDFEPHDHEEPLHSGFQDAPPIFSAPVRAQAAWGQAAPSGRTATFKADGAPASAVFKNLPATQKNGKFW